MTLGEFVRRQGLRAVGAAALVIGCSWSAAPAAHADLPDSTAFAGAVEGVALRVSAGAASSVANPGTAYSLAQLEAQPDFAGKRLLQIKAAAANNDPGDLGGAALFAAPTCDGPSSNAQGVLSGCAAPGVTPDTGLEAIEGFPGFAEAFYPVPEGRETAQKCLANKDAKPSDVCAGPAGTAYYAEALALPKAADGPATSALARNADVGSSGVIAPGGTTTSASKIFVDKAGTITSLVDSSAQGFQIPGAPFTIKSFDARAITVANKAGVTGDASCTFEISSGGQTFGPDQLGQLNALLDTISGATGQAYQVDPPTTTRNQTDAGGLEVGCTGAVIRVFDTPINSLPDLPGAPVSPKQGTSVSYLLGAASAKGSPLTDVPVVDFNSTLGGATSAVGGATPTVPSTSEAAPSAPASTGDTSTSGSGESPSSGEQAAAPTASTKSPAFAELGKPQLIRSKGPNATLLGSLVGTTGAVLIGGGWLAASVVLSLSRGTKLRMLGF